MEQRLLHTRFYSIVLEYDVAFFILGWKKCIVRCWTELFDSRCGIHLVKNTMISVESIRWYIDHSLLCFIKWNSVTTSVQHTWRVAQELIILLLLWQCLSFHSNCSRVTFSFVVMLIFSLVHSSDNTYLSVLVFLKFQSWRNFLTAPKFVFLSMSMHSSSINCIILFFYHHHQVQCCCQQRVRTDVPHGVSGLEEEEHSDSPLQLLLSSV